MIARVRRLSVVTSLIWLAVLGSHRAPAQTLDELQRPLLNENQVTVDFDYGQFADESRVAGVGGSYTYFEPAYHSLRSDAGIGLSKNIQLNISGTYLPPTRRPYSIFGDRSSTLDSRLMVRSLRAELVARPSDEVEIGVAYLRGRSRYTASFPYGIGTTSDDRATTGALQIRGFWLPQTDPSSRPMRADLDGLTGPLLRRHRVSVRWDALWRRYGETANEGTPGYPGRVDYDISSTDTRVHLGASLGVTHRSQVSADGYWQPPFTVTDLVAVTRLSGFDTADDNSDRFTDVFGWRADARWRPAQRLELSGSTRIEQQSVRDAIPNADQRSNVFHQAGVDGGVTWLSRVPRGSAPWQADLAGLNRPLLEAHQFRVDAAVHLRKYDDTGWHAHSAVWRVRAAVGLFSTLQTGLYAGRFAHGGDANGEGHSLGADLQFRPTRRLEAYGTLDYHPLTGIDRYPGFILDRGSALRSFRDFTETGYRDSASVHVGLRLVL
jgi:hypothetical protein